VAILALDTSTARGSIAIRHDGVTIISRDGDATRPHATRLPGDLVDALAECGATLDDVSVLAVCLGPGAFTGLRVGIATMQGLAFARNLPVVGVSALDAMASAVSGDAGDIAVWLDGARREVFAVRYRADRSTPFGVDVIGEPISAPPDAVMIEWARDGRPAPCLWVGEGATLYRDVLRRHVPEAVIKTIDIRRAELVARLAERASDAGLAVPPHALRPMYVRRPDAELARDRATSLSAPNGSP
jgi:tRNA threonylcarbamoyladenosine biosynthesis protein TsaB